MGSTAEAEPGSLRPAGAYLQTLGSLLPFLCSPLLDTLSLAQRAGLAGKRRCPGGAPRVRGDEMSRTPRQTDDQNSGSWTELWMAIRDIKQPWLGGPGRLVFRESPQGWSIAQGWGARKHKSRLKEGSAAKRRECSQWGNQEWKELRSPHIFLHYEGSRHVMAGGRSMRQVLRVPSGACGRDPFSPMTPLFKEHSGCGGWLL